MTTREISLQKTDEQLKTDAAIADREKRRVKMRGLDPRIMRAGMALVALLLLVSCGDDTPVSPPRVVEVEVPTLQEPANIAGSWEAIFRSDNVATGVASITLIQESNIAIGTWTDPVNGYTGTATVTISEGTKIIAFLSINSCTTAAEFRGDVTSETTMDWSSDGWVCAGSPQGVRLNWNKR